MNPKQFLALGTTSEPMITATAARVRAMQPPPALWIVTSEMLVAQTKHLVPDATVIAEPIGRNTAPSIGLAAAVAAKTNPEAVLVILPADHAVANPDTLRSVLGSAVSLARQRDVLVTIGIAPTFPHTGYGYIQRGAPLGGSPGWFEVRHFFEKPNLERAQAYCDSGDFLWNSGMFAFRASVVLAAIEEYLPALGEGLRTIQRAWGTPRQDQVLKEVFPTLESISIDVGVLEHVKNRALVEAKDFGWNDVGSWDAWAEQFPTDARGNVCSGDVLAIDSESCIVRVEAYRMADDGRPESGRRLVALLGVSDLVVIDSGDALLICPRSRVQEVKKVVDALRTEGRSELV
jgi:mannose-1-phosphate guanylyltransferase